jgi:hypothetical protein
MKTRSAFQSGFTTCCAASGGLLLALYTGGAPTSDVRARIPWLLGDRQTPFIFCVLFATGLMALTFTRAWSLQAVNGVAVSAFIVVLAVSGAALLHERRLNTDAPPSP